MEKLTLDNYKAGFLVDEELMAGVTESPQNPGAFLAYVVRHTTGETIGAHEYSNLFEAIRTVNDIRREWSFEKISKCGGGNCANGACKTGGGCGKKKEASPDSGCGC